MSDVAQLNLKEPDQIDWSNYNPGSKYLPPPPAKGVDGKPITYFGQLPKEFTFEADQEGYLQALVDPIVLTKNGQGVDGYSIRFTRVSVKQFQNKQGKPVNASSFGNLLRAASSTAKPQKNAEYEFALKQVGGRVVPFTIEWRAKNKDTGEEVKGYDNFPDDPERPGFKKPILRAGDQVVSERDAQGKPIAYKTITSDVLFANANVRYWQDPNKK